MEWLNYHHLLYFWTVARLGSIAKASEELLLAPPTISAQISRLETNLGEKLFTRSGRRLVLTDTGRIAFQFAGEIFALGREFTDTLQGRPTGRPLRLMVGIADVLPKGIAYRLIEPALRMDVPVRIICREDPPDRLLALLAIHQIDLILSDAPIGPGTSVRAFSHVLGDCGVGFYAIPRVANACKKRFPESLNGSPLLLPTEGSSSRLGLDQWFEARNIRPDIMGEFDDFALTRTFATAGHGILPAPWILDHEMRKQYGFRRVGRTEDVRVRFFAISIERKIKNPAVVAICETARHEIFAS